jgi:hypothetical protein
MTTDFIRYDLLVQDALRGVVRKVLSDAPRNGPPPGEHHFTITFRTDAPGVRMSRRLAEQWPHELTIILQHQYSDLMVDEAGFSVVLSFRGKPEQLYVPFESVTGFFDPSVEFGLKFEVAEGANDEEHVDEEAAPPARGPKLVTAEPAAAPAPSAKAPKDDKPVKKEDKKPADAPAEKTGAAGDDGAAKIVSIDAFRKKT